jgi:hypothetical protein
MDADQAQDAPAPASSLILLANLALQLKLLQHRQKRIAAPMDLRLLRMHTS